MAGYRVEQEQLIGHKKVDLVARAQRWGSEWIIGVECKDYQAPLQRRALVEIWADYEPLVSEHLLNEVLVVTANGVAPSAVTYVSSRRGLAAQTLGELIRSTVDFTTYLHNLANAFSESPDGIAEYYVPPKTSEHGDLDELVTGWIKGDSDLSSQPLAILGAYGIGKSSFATYLASKLARQALENPHARTPILVRLGEIAGEQSLEGLLGKHLTASYQVPGYSFSSFRSLNRAGQLVVILDGFDEMKQLLSWREFWYNLGQLNRLHDGDSRLILLGRPTAFETDDEHRLVLHGERKGRIGLVREVGWPEYVEIELSPLSPEQIKVFLIKYLRYRQSSIVEDPPAFDRLWRTIDSRQLRDIARRPVQLRMLAEILPEYSGDVEELDVGAVYDIFIDQLVDEVIRREEKKQSRLAFSSSDRRAFLRSIAYWLWEGRGGSTIRPELIPDELIAPFAKDEDLEPVRRDLIVGSPLDRRHAERVRFPHRSFQEFLVAEELWDRVSIDKADIQELDSLVTDEVAQFMALQRGEAQLMVARRLLGTLKGSVSWRFVNAVFLDSRLAGPLHEKFVGAGSRRSLDSVSLWEMLALSAWTVAHPRDEPILTQADVAQRSVSSSDPAFATLGFFVTLLLAANSRPDQGAIVSTLQTMLLRRGEKERITAARIEAHTISPSAGPYVINSRRQGRRVGVCLGRAHPVVGAKGRLEVSGGSFVEVLWLPDVVGEIVQRISPSRGGRSLVMRGLQPVLAAVLEPVAFIREWSDRHNIELLDLVDLDSARWPGFVDHLANVRQSYAQAGGSAALHPDRLHSR